MPEDTPKKLTQAEIDASKLSSYETALNRLKFVEERLQTTMALAAALTLAVPTVAKTQGIPLTSDLLVLALVLFVIGVGLGTYSRWMGEVKLLNPTHLYDEWLRCEEWVFKIDMVMYAGRDFEANRSLIKSKWRLGIITSLIFFLEFLLLFVWVSRPL
jgi:hypothetical protein